MRDNEKLQSLLRKHVERVVNDSFPHIGKIREISFILTSVKIVLAVKFDRQSEFEKSTRK